jgi:hypothetical protein
MGSGGFWWVLVRSGAFVLVVSAGLWWFLAGSDGCWRVLMTLDGPGSTSKERRLGEHIWLNLFLVWPWEVCITARRKSKVKRTSETESDTGNYPAGLKKTIEKSLNAFRRSSTLGLL